MLEIVGLGAGIASFVFLGMAAWRFAFWKGRRMKGWPLLAAWFACSIVAGSLLKEESPEEKAAREAAEAEANSAKMAAEAELIGAKTLADYIEMSRASRTETVGALMAAKGLPAEDTERFIACLGEYAPNKNPDLTLSNVFGWCETERASAPDNFAGHFNELDAPDHAVKASVVCRGLVKNNLQSPASADFPWIDDRVASLGRHEYEISSYVDSQNGFGAMLRSSYECRLKFKGGDADPLMASSWDVVRFHIE